MWSLSTHESKQNLKPTSRLLTPEKEGDYKVTFSISSREKDSLTPASLQVPKLHYTPPAPPSKPSSPRQYQGQQPPMEGYKPEACWALPPEDALRRAREICRFASVLSAPLSLGAHASVCPLHRCV